MILRKAPHELELEKTAQFHNVHEGQTCILVGNGPSLADIPDSLLTKYVSFGSNLCYKREGFIPNYYSTVDNRVRLEFEDEIMHYYAGIPKFLPSPNLDKWQGANIYRFRHRPGPLWPHPLAGPLWPRDLLSDKGITYVTVTNVLMQLAFYMGFNTILCVGLDNTPRRGHHFYEGHEWYGAPNMDSWDRSYGTLLHGFRMARPDTRIINLSTYTTVKSLEQDDWRNWE